MESRDFGTAEGPCHESNRRPRWWSWPHCRPLERAEGTEKDSELVTMNGCLYLTLVKILFKQSHEAWHPTPLFSECQLPPSHPNFDPNSGVMEFADTAQCWWVGLVHFFILLLSDFRIESSYQYNTIPPADCVEPFSFDNSMTSPGKVENSLSLWRTTPSNHNHVRYI